MIEDAHAGGSVKLYRACFVREKESEEQGALSCMVYLAVRVQQRDTIQDMLNMFPDHGNHLRAIAHADESVSIVVRDIGYDGPLELLTM